MLFFSNPSSGSSNSNTSTGGGKSPSAIQFYSNRYIDFRTWTTPCIIQSAQSDPTNNNDNSSSNNPSLESPSTTTTTTTPPSPLTRQRKNPNKLSDATPIHPYANLSYHAIHVPNEDDEEEAGGGGGSDMIMGMWNCRDTGSSTLISSLLQNVILFSPEDDDDAAAVEDGEEEKATFSSSSCRRSHHAAFVITLDMNEPNTIAPSIQSVTNAIVRKYDSSSSSSNEEEPIMEDGGSAATTSIKSLKDYLFGKVPPPPQGDEDEKKRITANHREKRISLMLACVLPSNPSTTYREKQEQALITYHLHRFAYTVNCSLAFIRPSGDTHFNSATNTVDSVDVPTLCNYVNRAALGLAPKLTFGYPNDDNDNEGKEDETKENVEENKKNVMDHHVALFPPNSLDPIMIETTLRRNASCEGIWDVDKNSLEEALPPPPPLPNNTFAAVGGGSNLGGKLLQEQPSNKSSGGGGGDQEWMSKLANSVKSETVIPAVVQKEPEKKGTNAANDAASFFESLLKK